ncbi:MAG: metallophosphoesterase [Firmicutes bacterium]|nr:metallophosphoesterase [Candidatus Fermentithermobacillaceae bacterium]
MAAVERHRRRPAGGFERACRHLADLHGKLFGKNQEYVRKLIAGKKVDLVVLTGDLVDEHTNSIEPLNSLLECLPEAPRFFVPGNHDKIAPVTRELYASLSKYGVTILDNKKVSLSKKGKRVSIVGLDDPYLGTPDPELLTGHGASEGELSILLCHAPTFGSQAVAQFKDTWDSCSKEVATSQKPRFTSGSVLELASRHDFDLVLAGHTHGGQIKIPGLGAVFVPGQGFPPRYVEGVYRSGSTAMFITRGLGTSRLPVRLFSRPEVAIIRWFTP